MADDFIPYSRQDISEDDIAAVAAVLRSQLITQGPVGPRFEAAFAQRHRAAHAVAVTNATAGLHLACLALGVGPGSLVWTSPNTFVASANCARYCGADVDFVDIAPDTRNMDVAALAAKLARARAQGRLPQVVIPVDYAGLPCDIRAIRALAGQYGFRIVRDASHATGAQADGEPVGSAHADITVFSFHAVKIVTTAEGGMLLTQDRDLAHKLQLLRSHGITRDVGEFVQPPEGAWVYEQQLLGYNCRMTEVQAALGLSQLARLDAMQARREAHARRYGQVLAGLPLVLPPQPPEGSTCAWHLYAVEIDARRCGVPRKEVFQRMREAGIGVNVHYIPVHLQPYYAALGFRPGDFPHAERFYAQALSLPLFPAMTEAQQDRVAHALRRALEA